MRPGKRRALDKQTKLGALLEKAEKFKVSVRAKVEHPFRVIKCQFGFTKSALQRAGQEHGAVDHAVCPEQSVDGAPTTDGTAGMSAPAVRASAHHSMKGAANRGQYAQEIGANAPQSASCEFLTLNSRYGGVMQTFPSAH